MDERWIGFVIALLTIILNIIQLWCLHKHFRRHVNPLMVVIFHLSVADLIQGTIVISTFILMLLRKCIFPGSSLLKEIFDFYGEANKCLSAVSIVTLVTLTVLKMLRVTQNKWFTKSTVRRICRTIWIVVVLCFSTDYVVYKAGGYPGNEKLVVKYRPFWLPVLALPATVILVVCFARMFCVMRTRMIQPVHEHAFRRRFLTIAILHLVSFVVFVAPATALIIADALIHIDPEQFEKLRRVFIVFIISNPLFDSIGFFIVYRGKLRGRRITGNLELSTLPGRQLERNLQVQENHESSDEERGRVAVICNTV